DRRRRLPFPTRRSSDLALLFGNASAPLAPANGRPAVRVPPAARQAGEAALCPRAVGARQRRLYRAVAVRGMDGAGRAVRRGGPRSEEYTSELQSQSNLV